ncbi:MAG: NmrA family NAD(P)-binding protein [Oscillospiraceae bacterium]|nr:NmrA family NAD(P)-binding protein [Oscillospiraceae bacterium]
MVLAVTGITGHSGSFMLQQLIDNKFDGTLRCIVRETSNTKKLDESGLKLEKVVGSTKDPESLRKLVEGADTVMHISGIWETLGLLEAIEETGGKPHVLLVHTSAIHSKHKMACEVYKSIESDMQKYVDAGMNITILRPTMIFGDMKDRNISKFIRMVHKFPIMPQIDKGEALVQPVNARDLGQAYYKACMHEKLPEYDYIISGERPVSIKELCSLIGEYLGKKTRFIFVPMWIGVAGAEVLCFLRGKKDRLLVEKVLRLGENRSFSHESASRDFGYEPEKFEIGLKREVEEFIRNGRN